MKERYFIIVKNADFLIILMNGKPKWQITIPKLNRLDDTNGTSTRSKWTMHLSGERWTTIELLYEFATHIQTLHPINDIDWLETFMLIERAEYLEQAFEIKEKLEGRGKAGNFKKLTRQLKFGIESYNEDELDQVRVMVIEKLHYYGLPFSEDY